MELVLSVHTLTFAINVVTLLLLLYAAFNCLNCQNFCLFQLKDFVRICNSNLSIKPEAFDRRIASHTKFIIAMIFLMLLNTFLLSTSKTTTFQIIYIFTLIVAVSLLSFYYRELILCKNMKHIFAKNYEAKQKLHSEESE
jgi:hypothetical protein